jgi:dTDP-glucose pyrophosphorylase
MEGVSIDDVSILFVYPSTTIQTAIEVINRGAVQIALCVDDSNKLMGVLTDGDVRRALIGGSGLESTIAEILRNDFISVPDSTPRETVLEIMLSMKLHHVPAVDEYGFVKRLWIFDELLRPKPHENWVIVMAGGEGKRLHPLTKSQPKPMVYIGEKPMLELILEQCIHAHFKKFFISVNYLKDQIMDYFGDGSQWGVELRYLEEKSPLGTAGSLSLLPARPSDPVIVINGDVLTRVDFASLLDFHQSHDASITISARTHETQIPYGVIQSNGIYLSSIAEKPILTHFVNAGVYVINPDQLTLLHPGVLMDMPQLVDSVIESGEHVAVFPIHEYWMDVGTESALARARSEWK